VKQRVDGVGVVYGVFVLVKWVEGVRLVTFVPVKWVEGGGVVSHSGQALDRREDITRRFSL
jgi:hypothetical protein